MPTRLGALGTRTVNQEGGQDFNKLTISQDTKNTQWNTVIEKAKRRNPGSAV